MDATQKQINKMMGVSDEVFAKYNPGPDVVRAKAAGNIATGLTETQLAINKAMGVSEETWEKYNTTAETQEAKKDGIVTIIPKMGYPLFGPRRHQEV